MGAGKDGDSRYPKHVFLILGNEFCERFSFYGMKAILVLFLNRALRFEQNTSTAIYHAFNVVCYFMPVFGAMIADGLLGKYKTIFIISIVYSIGNVVMAMGAIPWNSGKFIQAIPFVGLALIALGTGGIKPCVSAFGADQFKEHQMKQKETFFSLFYMAINLGSLLSMIITPIIRSNVTCFGGQECYALAFGIPAGLMIVAVVFFIAGSSYYTKHPPGDNIIGDLFGCIGTALKGKCGCSGNRESREHWLDYADSKYPKTFVTDVKSVMRVLFMFLPLPIFWALFDQQGSRWTLQAGQMNGDFFGGGFVLQPDLIQVLNPLIVVIIVPILESLVFPCLDKLGIPNRPLQRLGLGMFLAGTAFVVTGFVQIGVDGTLPASIANGNSRATVLNTMPCKLGVNIFNNEKSLIGTQYVNAKQQHILPDFASNINGSVQMAFSECDPSSKAGLPENITRKVEFLGGKAYNLVATLAATDKSELYLVEQNQISRTPKGEATIIFSNTLNITVTTKVGTEDFTLTPGSFNDTKVKHSKSKYVFKENGTDIVSVTVDAKAGAVNTVVLHWSPELDKKTSTTFVVITPNTMNMLFQVPQYIVMSLGECFFSVTGLSFAYSQAPPSMKAVLQAAWLLTNSFGNLIVMIISAIGKLPSQTAEFFMFAGIMYITVIIFAIMSLTFKYREPTFSLEEDEDENKQQLEGYDNLAMTQNDEKPPTYKEVSDVVSSTYM